MVILFTILLLFLYNIGVAQGQSLQVETQNGWVIGRQINNIYGWNGIPYAKPPINNLRFEVPQRPNNWSGVWNATYDRSACVQSPIVNLNFTSPEGSEDCLYINVYSPQLPDGNTLFPVMVWIYGGGFSQGSSSYALYGPDQLVEQGVIVVSFNYRLGIFGFLSTGDSVAPGNNGLKDQIFALQWVQNNIANFGGDPQQVTIFGQSAGSASVSYLVSSPRAAGLFRGAIMESGTTLCSWSLSRAANKSVSRLSSILGLGTIRSSLLVAALKAIPAYTLQRISITLTDVALVTNVLNGFVFAPVIELESSSAVITSSTYARLLQGDFNQVPQIIGYNSNEVMQPAGVLELLVAYLATYDLFPARLVSTSMNANALDLNTIGNAIRNYYAGSSGVISYPSENFINFLNDDFFIRPIQETIHFTSQYVNTYFYIFSYNHDQPAVIGAAHADELQYLFNSDYNNESDLIIKSCLTQLWTNFAKYLNPTPVGSNVCGGITWAPTEPNPLSYIDINTTVTTGEDPELANMNFWRNLFAQYANPPRLTY